MELFLNQIGAKPLLGNFLSGAVGIDADGGLLGHHVAGVGAGLHGQGDGTDERARL